MARKKAVNWVVTKYSILSEKANTEGKKVEAGSRKALVNLAVSKFKIVGEFDVLKQTIHCRMKAGHLEVWHTGTT